MSAPPLDAAAREAIDWMVQLHSGEASARDRQAFEAWLRRDARHEPIRPMPTLPSHPSALRRGLRPAVLAGAAPLAAHAQSGVAAAERAYDIPPQALGASLTRIAEESGERISIDSESVRGLSASPVRGRYTAEQAARKALEDSGLQLSRTGNGTLTVRRAEAVPAPAAALAAPAVLPGVTISGKAPGATTEGPGAYETNSSSSSTRINLSPQETPQSLTVVTRQRLDDQRSAHLSDVLEGISGIFVTRDGLGAESDGFWLRGFEIQNYEVDGVPTSSLLNHYSENMAMYDRVENRHDSVYTYLNGMLQRDGSGTSLLPTRFKGTPRQHNLDVYLTGAFSLFGRRHEVIGGLALSQLRDAGPSYGGWQYDYSASAVDSIADLFAYGGGNAAPTFGASGHSSDKTRNHVAYLTSRFNVSDDLKLIEGGRAIRWRRDIATLDNTGARTRDSDRESVFVPYVGAVYDLNARWTAYASATKIFNPQSYGVCDENNNTLDPMEGRGLEAGLKGSDLGGKPHSSIAVFHLKQDNLAVWQAQYPGSYGFYGAPRNLVAGLKYAF